MTPVRKILITLAAVTTVTFAAAGVSLLYLGVSFHPPTRSAQTGAQRIAAGQARLAKIADAKEALLETRVISWINCGAHEGQAPWSTWRELALNDKRATVQALSGICEMETGYARVTIVDDKNGRTLAAFDAAKGVQVY